MNNKGLLFIATGLVAIGLFKPDLSSFSIPALEPKCSVETYVTDAPADTELLNKARIIINILGESNDSTKPSDCMKLSALYSDMATLISLDNEDEIIKDTASIKSANSLAGKMLRLDIKDKYPNLAESAKDLLITAIGSDDVILDNTTRQKSVNAFRALSWAFYEGSK
jgi:hypothetical protein